MLAGCVAYDSAFPVSQTSEVADNYLQLVVSSDSVLLITSFTSGDLVAVSVSGKMSKPINNGFRHSYHLLGPIAKHFISTGVHDSMIASISDDGGLCVVIPIVFNGTTIAVEFIDGFKMGESTFLSPNGGNSLDPPTFKKLQKWACSIGTQILRRASAYYENKSPKIIHDSFYVNSVLNYSRVHEYLDNLYSPCYDYDFVSGTWNCSRKVKTILGIDDSYRYDFSGFLGLFARESKVAAYKYFTQVLKGDTDEIDIDLEVIRPSDHVSKWITINGSLITGTDGEIVKIFGSISDITLYKETQFRLKAEIDERAKLMGIIGHDLRNPFNAIIGFSDMLEKVLKQKRYNDAIEFAGIMRDSASRGYELLVNLLDYSKCVTGRIRMNITEFDLNDVVESVISLVRLMADNKNITIYNKVLSGTIVSGDPNIISTVLRNLVSNAIKFCFCGGSIGIEVAEEDGGKKRISVWDTGVVISPETISHIMNARQVSSTSGTNGETGTGLGLQLCSNFLAMHDSRLYVSSNDAKTEFSFLL
ncbi:MAG: HAMP domain-containing histidine kinase [Bacteroidales bacterium]|nr:HAMP domain-containing histidine kinase [Bacteroidales bacterium]